MSDHVVDLLIDGRSVHGWSSMNWKSSLSALVDELEVQMPAVIGAGIVGGEQVLVRVDGDGLFSGWADSVEVSISSFEAVLSLRCRSKTADVVDSAVDLAFKPAELYNVTLFDVLVEYVKYWIRVPVRTRVDDLPVIPKVAVQPGETIFELIERYARQAGVLLRTDSDGALAIERAAREVSKERLIIGENLAECQVKIDLAQRFRFTKVIGQSPTEEGGGGEEATGASGEAIDQAIRPTRVAVAQAAGPVSPEDCKAQAKWHAAVAAAKSSGLSCKVVGWMAGDTVWRPNSLVDVDLGQYGFNGRFLLEAVSLDLSSQGGYSGSLDLVGPAAYSSEPIRTEADDGVREKLKDSGWAS